MSESRLLDLGFWFPRPERGARLAHELRRRGHRVTIYHDLPIPGDPTNVRHTSYSLLKGLRVLRRLSHDVLYTSRSFLPVLQLRINKSLTGRPYVYTLNGVPWAYYGDRAGRSKSRRAKRALYPWLLHQALGSADAVVANSRFLANTLEARFPKIAPKVSAIHNGIDFNAVGAGLSVPGAWLPGAPRVLSVVTPSLERKAEGVRLLLDAFDLIARREPEASYLIAAKCETPRAIDPIAQYLKGLRCAERVRLEVNRSDVPDLLATADLFLYATPADSSDSMPRAVLEAQAVGVPTVATNTVGCGEAVLNGETGKLVEYDAKAIANAASELLHSGSEASQMGVAARKSVRERFSWDEMSQAYERVFLRIAAKTDQSLLTA